MELGRRCSARSAVVRQSELDFFLAAKTEPPTPPPPQVPLRVGPSSLTMPGMINNMHVAFSWHSVARAWHSDASLGTRWHCVTGALGSMKFGIRESTNGRRACYCAIEFGGTMTNPENSQRFWPPTLSASAGSPALTKTARLHVYARCGAISSIRRSRFITDASLSAPATAPGRVSFRGRRGALRDRSAERHGRAQRRLADRSPDRVPHRHSFGRRRRRERRRSHGRRRQHRCETGGNRPAGRDLSLGGRLPAGARKTRPRSQRPRRNAPQEHRRAGARLFASGRPAAGEAFRADCHGPATTRKSPRRSPSPTSPRSRCCRSRT